MVPEQFDEDGEVITIEETESAPEVDNSETVIEAPDAVVEANPTIVVETAPEEESVSDSEIDRAVQTAERLTALEGVVGGLVNEVAELRVQATVAEEVSEVAITTAVETAAEVEEVAEEVEADEPPSDSGPHWFFESREDRKRRKGKL